MDWLLSVALLLVGGFVIIMNWTIVFYALFKKKYSSWAPLVGGVLAAVGLAILPMAGVAKYWYVPLIIDYGCLPGMAHTAWFYLTGRHRQP
jgi:hypothetical protein